MSVTLVSVFLFIAFIWLVVLTVYIYKLGIHYSRLLKGSGKENLINILDEIVSREKFSKTEIARINSNLKKLELESLKYIQKVGILRFNPFEESGGEQSFVLSILNGEDSGIVLTSLNNRGQTRWYVKNVKSGKGLDHDLSEEELKAIRIADKIEFNVK